MKNWQIVFWLVVFFPVGLYLMFRYSDWQKPVKYGIVGIFTLSLFLIGAENWTYLFFLGSFFAIIVGLFAVFRKKSRRKGFMALALGLLVLTASGFQMNEYAVQEQLAIEAEAEAERLAEEERLAEIAKQEEQERLEEEKRFRAEQKQIKEDAIEAIEAVEEAPTQAKYEKAMRLLEKLETKDAKLTARLDDILPEVEAYETLASAAEEAVKQAQSDKTRETYNHAYEMVEALPIGKRGLSLRLEKLDRELVEAEEEARLAAEKAAEEERLAQEKAAETQRQAEVAAVSSQASGGNSSSDYSSESSGSTAEAPAIVETPPAQTDNATRTVYIAPQSGTKYHYSAGCRGLSNANSIQEMSLSEAESQGYELCGWE